jgi:iron uptake system component EfeO
VTSRRVLTVALAAILAASTGAGCSAKDSKTSESAKAASTQVTVNATDSECVLSASEGGTGSTTFVVTNNGNKVTELYVYDKDDRVLGEVENISPGLQRQLAVDFSQPGTYKVACKPGMVGDGIRTGFTVKANQP